MQVQFKDFSIEAINRHMKEWLSLNSLCVSKVLFPVNITCQKGMRSVILLLLTKVLERIEMLHPQVSIPPSSSTFQTFFKCFRCINYSLHSITYIVIPFYTTKRRTVNGFHKLVPLSQHNTKLETSNIYDMIQTHLNMSRLIFPKMMSYKEVTDRG